MKVWLKDITSSTLKPISGRMAEHICLEESAYIMYPSEIPIRPLVSQVLDYSGYLAADKILDFLDKRYPKSYLIEIAKGVLPEDLTDEFAMMVEWNHSIEKEDEKLAKVELPEVELKGLDINKPSTPPEGL